MVLVIVNHLILTIENNDFLILGEGPTYGINGSFGSQEKKVSINFSTANTKLCLRLHYNVDNSYLFVNEKEIFKFKADNKNVNFSTQFCLGSISNGFSSTESREVSLNGIVYDFSVDYNSFDKPCIVRPTLIDMNPVELKYHLFVISLSKCSGSCNILSLKMCSKRNKNHIR